MDIVLFGSERFAELAWHAITHDSEHCVVGFAVHAAYRKADELCELPVVDFETVEQSFDPATTGALASVGWTGRKSNQLRAQICGEMKDKGFELASYVSSRAHVAAGTRIGAGCMIFDGAIVQPFSRIGDGVILRSGSHISHHTSVDDFSFFASEAATGGGCSIGRDCFVGLNATVFDNVSLGDGTIVAAGAVVRKSTAENAVVRSDRP